MREKPYRENVAMMIVRPDHKVWLGTRAGKSLDPHHNKQVPQGGIDAGETPDQAVWRELYEEVGLTPQTAQLIAVSKKWYTYDFPAFARGRIPQKFKGQKQKWFLFLLTGDDHSFNLQGDHFQEFVDFEWVDVNDITNHIIDFKRSVYEQAIAEFKPIIEKL